MEIVRKIYCFQLVMIKNNKIASVRPSFFRYYI